jgi:type II secretory pathway component GspD/PulD (secretin)
MKRLACLLHFGIFVTSCAALATVSCTSPSTTLPKLAHAVYSPTTRDAHVIPVPDSDEIVVVTHSFSVDPDDLLPLIRHLVPVKIEFDGQAYHVVIRGKPSDVDQALSIIVHLEQTRVLDEKAKVFTVQLKNANALQLASTLQEMNRLGFFVGDDHAFIFIPDTRTNSLIISCGRVYEDRTREIISELDRSLIPSTEPQREIRIERGNISPSPQP